MKPNFDLLLIYCHFYKNDEYGHYIYFFCCSVDVLIFKGINFHGFYAIYDFVIQPLMLLNVYVILHFVVTRFSWENPAMNIKKIETQRIKTFTVFSHT